MVACGTQKYQNAERERLFYEWCYEHYKFYYINFTNWHVINHGESNSKIYLLFYCLNGTKHNS